MQIKKLFHLHILFFKCYNFFTYGYIITNFTSFYKRSFGSTYFVHLFITLFSSYRGSRQGLVQARTLARCPRKFKTDLMNVFKFIRSVNHLIVDIPTYRLMPLYFPIRLYDIYFRMLFF